MRWNWHLRFLWDGIFKRFLLKIQGKFRRKSVWRNWILQFFKMLFCSIEIQGFQDIFPSNFYLHTSFHRKIENYIIFCINFHSKFHRSLKKSQTEFWTISLFFFLMKRKTQREKFSTPQLNKYIQFFTGKNRHYDMSTFHKKKVSFVILFD